MASIPLVAAAFVFWRASRAKEEATAEVLSKSEFRFQVVPIDRAVPPGTDAIGANPDFRDVAAFHGSVIVSARSGLFVYDRTGALTRWYRAGFELPPAELGPMCTGIAAGSAEPELFIATRGEGLLAFNGTRFRQILPEDAALRTITAVLALASGRILLGTERHGLLVFDGRRVMPFHPLMKFAHITAVAGKDGDLWIGTLRSGVFHHRAGQLDDLAAALPDPQVLALLVEDGVAYVGTPLGVVEFRDGRRFRTIADGFFARALARFGDTLQVATEDEGIVEVSLWSRRTPRAPPEAEWAPAPVFRLAHWEGDLYGVSDKAVYRFEPARRSWRPILTVSRSVLADRNVSSVLVSRGRLWVGYFDRGLDVVEMEFERSVHHEDDALFCVNRIVEDPSQQRIAVATANGLALFDSNGQARQVMGRKDGFLSDHITDVAFRDGEMVVATPAGLSFVDRSGVRSLYAFHGLVNNHVYAVAAWGNQTIAGTLGGVSILEDDVVRANYTTANSHLRHNWITALARVGDDWFAGTYGGGVLRFDRNGEWRPFAGGKDGFVVNPNAMAVSDRYVYAGSLDRGLYIFDRSSGRWANTIAGLPSRNVTALAASEGYLYVGTDNGLIRVSERALR
jgi:hypothetical protein